MKWKRIAPGCYEMNVNGKPLAVLQIVNRLWHTWIYRYRDDKIERIDHYIDELGRAAKARVIH